MTQINRINVSLPYKLGSVNCYLVKNDSDYFLIDTGSSNKRTELVQELVNTGCKPDNLKLIILTHGDFDHAGNAAYLRHRFGTRIAIHKDDLGMVEDGDMFTNRNRPNILVQKLISLLSGFGKAERFKPDLFIEDGYELSEYGFAGRVLSIPGHSKGSVGILTANGDLFCGDLLENQNKPALNSIMDDLEAANASLEKLKRYEISTVYPGHGNPFLMKQFIQANSEGV